MRPLEDLLDITAAGLRNWPKDQGELKFARGCSSVLEFVNSAPGEYLVWLATQLDRHTMQNRPEWTKYQLALTEAGSNFQLVSLDTQEGYQLDSVELAKRVITTWAQWGMKTPHDKN